jgi:hypothetical protein
MRLSDMSALIPTPGVRPSPVIRREYIHRLQRVGRSGCVNPLFNCIAVKRPVESRGPGADSRQRVLPTHFCRVNHGDSTRYDQSDRLIARSWYAAIVRRRPLRASRSRRYSINDRGDNRLDSRIIANRACDQAAILSAGQSVSPIRRHPKSKDWFDPMVHRVRSVSAGLCGDKQLPHATASASLASRIWPISSARTRGLGVATSRPARTSLQRDPPGRVLLTEHLLENSRRKD